jgi:hypothetical protein
LQHLIGVRIYENVPWWRFALTGLVEAIHLTRTARARGRDITDPTVLQAMEQLRFSGDDANLIAYAGQRVRQLVKQLDTEVSRELSPMGELVELERAISEGRDVERNKVTIQDLGATSNLDIDELERLCAEVIEAARVDLRGD